MFRFFSLSHSLANLNLKILLNKGKKMSLQTFVGVHSETLSLAQGNSAVFR